MTGRAQCNKVVGIVGFVLILKLAASLDMMNIQAAIAWAASYTASLACLVTSAYVLAYRLPVPAVCKFFSTSIMRAVLSCHELSRAFTGAEPAPVLGDTLERAKGFSAVLTVQIHGSYQTVIRATGRAMMNGRRLLIESLAAGGARNIFHLGAPPSEMAFSGAELSYTFCAIGLALKPLAALGAYLDH